MSTIVADDVRLAATIFTTVIHGMVKVESPKTFLHVEVASLEKYPQGITIVFDCEEADIVIVSTLKDIPLECAGKLLFGTKYSQLKDQRVVGAFFWQKGRPNILFYKSRLEEKQIELDSSFKKYVE
jgi:hypothetical protein